MKFCIFGSNNDKIITRKALFESNCLDDAVGEFKKYIDEIKFDILFLIMDTECQKRSFITTFEGKGDDYIPFYIIGQWKIGQDRNNWIRKDRTQIIKNGFTREFENNLKAISRFIEELENSESAELRIIYSKLLEREYDNYIQFFNKRIAFTEELNMKKHYKTKIYCLESPEWMFVPLEKTKFNMFKIEGGEAKGDKIKIAK